MASNPSICNYSHPELQITEGLDRTDQGSLFPYNPEFYDYASGLYGPGSFYCWFLLLGSFVLNWVTYPLETKRQALHATAEDEGGGGAGVGGGVHHRRRRPGLSNDLLAVVAFPVFAATDAFIQAMRWIGTEYRALAIFCLRYPTVEMDMFADFNQTQLDLKEIPPDILELGRRSIDISGPLNVAIIFDIVFFFLIIIFHASATALRPSHTARMTVYGSYAYVTLALFITYLSLGDFGTAYFLALYAYVMPVLAFVFCSFSLVILLGFLGGLAQLVTATVAGRADRAIVMDSLKLLGSTLVLGGIIVTPLLLGWSVGEMLLMPDLGVSIRERDQVATLVVGIVSLCFTIADVVRRVDKGKDKEEGEEMQELSRDVG